MYVHAFGGKMVLWDFQTAEVNSLAVVSLDIMGWSGLLHLRRKHKKLSEEHRKNQCMQEYAYKNVCVCIMALR